MPKQKTPETLKNDPLVGSVIINRFRVNRMAAAHLKELAKTGLYGTQVTDVIRTMVYQSIRELVRENHLTKINFDHDTHGPQYLEPEASEFDDEEVNV